jgi:hypothetical protein
VVARRSLPVEEDRSNMHVVRLVANRSVRGGGSDVGGLA